MAALLAVAGLAAACTITPSGQPGAVEHTQLCRDDALGSFVGQPASQDIGVRMLRASGAKTIRWVPKGGIVTMDFRGDRLTVQLDGSSRVETARCG